MFLFMICVMKLWERFVASTFISLLLPGNQSAIGQVICFDSALNRLVCAGKDMLLSSFVKVFAVSCATGGTIYQRHSNVRLDTP